MLPDIVISPAASGVIAAMAAVTAYLFRLLWESSQSDRKKEVAGLEDQRDSYMKMAARATWALEAAANKQRAMMGLPPFDIIDPVVPEHNSPTTEAQQQQADFQTLQAKVVPAAKILDVDLTDAPTIDTPAKRPRSAELLVLPTVLVPTLTDLAAITTDTNARVRAMETDRAAVKYALNAAAAGVKLDLETAAALAKGDVAIAAALVKGNVAVAAELVKGNVDTAAVLAQEALEVRDQHSLEREQRLEALEARSAPTDAAAAQREQRITALEKGLEINHPQPPPPNPPANS